MIMKLQFPMNSQQNPTAVDCFHTHKVHLLQSPDHWFQSGRWFT